MFHLRALRSIITKGYVITSWTPGQMDHYHTGWTEHWTTQPQIIEFFVLFCFLWSLSVIPSCEGETINYICIKFWFTCKQTKLKTLCLSLFQLAYHSIIFHQWQLKTFSIKLCSGNFSCCTLHTWSEINVFYFHIENQQQNRKTQKKYFWMLFCFVI